jgi:protease I
VVNKSILIFLAAKNFNEGEFLTLKNAVERKKLKMFVASDANSLCIGDKGLKIRPDVSKFNMKAVNFGGLAIVGGEGIRQYWTDKNLQKLVLDFAQQRKPVGAICLAPIVLAKAGLLKNKKAVCYPQDKIELEKESAVFTDEPVVIEGKIVTAKDPLAAEEFADSLIYLLSQ